VHGRNGQRGEELGEKVAAGGGVDAVGHRSRELELLGQLVPVDGKVVPANGAAPRGSSFIRRRASSSRPRSRLNISNQASR